MRIRLRKTDKTKHERIWGDHRAKNKNPARSYERDRPLLEGRFECENCGKRFTRLILPGTFPPSYCSETCRKEVARARTRERVRRYREARRQEQSRHVSEQ